jgi:hypothetical protein
MYHHSDLGSHHQHCAGILGSVVGGRSRPIPDASFAQIMLVLPFHRWFNIHMTSSAAVYVPSHAQENPLIKL